MSCGGFGGRLVAIETNKRKGEKQARPNGELRHLSTTAMSAPSTSTIAPTQQVNVADLELPQLVEVKRQLEEVCNSFSCSSQLVI